MYKLKNFDFQPVEGKYEIFEHTETMDSVSVILATEKNKAVVYVEMFDKIPEKVAEFENPTTYQKEKFFTNQFYFWLFQMIDTYNIVNINNFLDSPLDGCSFEYYCKNNNGYGPVTISSENGSVYFMADDKVKVFIGKEKNLNDALLDMLIKKTFFDYLIKLTENL